ncbi:hypothetical protein [Mycobacterium riyadhense]|uniref:hypothetical protein n=1 Tax=Mycobacterium riyadhense TaxID=486698 RepID=UPI001958FA7D|nr:hypothetical protein [Mycobacterium riyadhense]
MTLHDSATGNPGAGTAGRVHLTGSQGSHSRRTGHHSTTTTHTALEIGGIR